MACLHVSASLTLLASLTLMFGIEGIQSQLPTLPDVSKYLSTICSNFKDCQNDADISNATSNPSLYCCVECSCDASCVEQHSCCPGSPHVTDNVTPYSSGLNNTVCRNTLYRGKPKNVYFNPEYEFVQICLEYSDETTKQKCENAARTNDSGVYDNIPVYDPDSQNNYANIHCAKCNMASTADVLVWQPKLKCDDNVDLQTISTNIDLGIREYNCEVMFVPPDSIPDIPPCFNDVITECNITGDLAVYDKLDAYFCQELDMLYVSVVNQTRKYRNIFCARCNGEIIHGVLPSRCPFEQGLDATRTLKTLIKYTLSDVEQTVGTIGYTHRCHRAYEYDPLTEDCKQVLCSPPYYFDVTTSTCQLFYQTVTNAAMLHPYYLKLDTILQFEDVLPLVNEIYPAIRYIKGRFTCNIGIYYQTDIEGHSTNLSKSISSDKITVKGVYLMIFTSIFNDDPSKAFKTYSELHKGYILSVNKTKFTLLGPETFDQGMLQFDDTDETITTAYEEFTNFKDGRPSHYLFQNPYDNTVILGHVDNIFNLRCLPDIFKTDFMDCPAHIYEFTEEFRRVSGGLTIDYKNMELLFPFDQFKTARNSTAVRICSQAVDDRVNRANASGTRSVFFLIIACYIFTLGMGLN